MKLLHNADGRVVRRIFRANMVLGLVITLVAVYLLITGQYDNLQARLAAESLLGNVAIGGLLYLVAFWYICLFSKSLLPARDER
jgi:presenilin-like A22 family membrane protease